MTSTTAVAQVSRDFVKEVRQLMDDWKPIKEEYAQLAKKHIEFAQLVVSLWKKAIQLDKGTGESTHKDYMRTELQQLIQTEDPSIISRWRTIGEQADKLQPVAKQLPADRDHLYELAKAAKQNKPLSTWVADKKVHPQVSVRAIRQLTSEGVRSKPKAKSTRHYRISLTFSQEADSESIISLMKSALLSDLIIGVKANHQSIRAECESSLREDYSSHLHQKFDY